jgi:hypothetical protein
MIELMVIIRSATGDIEGLGRHSFRTAPRTGEYLTLNDKTGNGQAYRIRAVVHPLEPAPTAGDLILEYVGADIEIWRIRECLIGVPDDM